MTMASNRKFTKEERIAAVQRCYLDLGKVPRRDEYFQWRNEQEDMTAIPSAYNFKSFKDWNHVLMCSGLVPLLAYEGTTTHAETSDPFVVEAPQVKSWLIGQGLEPPFPITVGGISSEYLHRLWKGHIHYVPLVLVDKFSAYLRDPGAIVDGRLKVLPNPLIDSETFESYQRSVEQLETQD